VNPGADPRPMRLAVTGGTGVIGRQLCVELNARGHALSVLGRAAEPPAAIAGAIAPARYLSTTYEVEPLARALTRIAPQALVHMAARRPLRAAADGDEFADNITLAASVFEACRSTGIRNVLFLSSIAVYSPANPLPWHEEQVPVPHSAYGRSKLAGEALAARYNDAGTLAVKSLRIAQVLSPNEHEGTALRTFLDRAARGQTLEVWGDASGRRHYVYDRDVVRAIEHAARANAPADIYNIGMRENHSFAELARAINRAFGNDGNLVEHTDRPADPGVYHMDIERAARALDWAPAWDLDAALADIARTPPGEARL